MSSLFRALSSCSHIISHEFVFGWEYCVSKVLTSNTKIAHFSLSISSNEHSTIWNTAHFRRELKTGHGCMWNYARLFHSINKQIINYWSNFTKSISIDTILNFYVLFMNGCLNFWRSILWIQWYKIINYRINSMSLSFQHIFLTYDLCVLFIALFFSI